MRLLVRVATFKRISMSRFMNRKKKQTTRKKKAGSKKGSAPLQRNVLGVFLIMLAVFVFVAVLTIHANDPPGASSGDVSTEVKNAAGRVGAFIAYYLVEFTFGRYITLLLPIMLSVFGIQVLRAKGLDFAIKLGLVLTAFAFLSSVWWELIRILVIPEAPQVMQYTGLIGTQITHSLLVSAFGNTGSVILMVTLSLVYFTIVLRIHWASVGSAVGTAAKDTGTSLYSMIVSAFQRMSDQRKQRKQDREKISERESIREQKEEPKPIPKEEPTQQEIFESPIIVTTPSEVDRHFEQSLEPLPLELVDENGEVMGVDEEDAPPVYRLPSIDLLEPGVPEESSAPDEREMQVQADNLEQRLDEFGVKAKVVQIHPGPVVTRYDLHPAPGVKVGKIASLERELAMSLTASSVRILAPIPGTNAVGIEVPNANPSMVRIHDIVTTPEFRETECLLPMALGKTAQGETFVADLVKMPHMLIAGTTGSGKSVCINTIVASLLLSKKPDEILIAMVDPKKVELSAYGELRKHHLIYIEQLEEVIATKPKNAVQLLQSLTVEMDHRYDQLAETGLPNIQEYNKRVEEGRVPPDDEGNPRIKLPYIVLIVDELADLMLTAAKEVEEPIARLTQMARAVGIHLIVATQRPSVDVITGVIKANFPARLAFKVRSKIDSRTILDMPGAEALLGRGDSLFLSSSAPAPVRVHGALITTDETHALIAHVANQPKFVKPCELKMPVSEGGGGGGDFDIEDGRDDLFEEAVRVVSRHQQGSVSLLQRRLKVGYSRAGRILDQLEQAGIVGPFEGSKARDVLMSPEEVEEFLNPSD